ncbi:MULTISPECIES: hypothetical protein [unclassified Bacillus (in: firmicutes)]|uniref:hypothetical protein n=1 Tax=unclassified Bacillus (in: firmicutes) TaxID=185979 RepID=UPI0008EC4C7F|nr:MULTISPECIES: hypothetical protein [unclassified Bacillus (in: firmicutes)]SFB19930.1 Tetratricopeptide repeat-containing protein [Bacillus sp. UNCCL13]SFQ90787.1 Tetratricopeptide repeat-containing protein [Bacillus sp. cl95]
MEVLQAVQFNIDGFLQKLDHLPDYKEREYEVRLTNLSLELSVLDFKDLREWLNNKYLQIDNEDEKLFAVFNVLCSYSRRKKDTSVFKQVVEESGSRFVGYPLYPHILSLLYKEMGELERSIQSAKEATIELNNQVGVLHNYAEAIVHARENNLAISDEQIKEAFEIINRVTGRLDPFYAKFHCTRGRILAQLGQYTEAKKAILKAIDEEESSKSDYSIRINDYQYHLIRIQTSEFNKSFHGKLESTEKSLENQKKDIEKSMQNLKTENLQMLGFFVAIISFTIGSLNILEGKKFLESGLLILILMGSTVLAYIGFGMLFSVQVRNKLTTIIVSSLAVLVIIGAFSGYYLLK